MEIQKRNIKKVCKRLNGAVMGLMTVCLCPSVALASSDVTGGALTDAAKQGAEGLTSEFKNLLPWLIAIVVSVGGLVLIATGRRGKEGVKELAPQIVIGIAMIIFAIPIALWLFGIFKG